MSLEQILAHGNRTNDLTAPKIGNVITCADGFTMSVLAGAGTYCFPRPAFCFGLGDLHPHKPVPPMANADCQYPGPYAAAEVGFPSDRPEPWDQWVRHTDDDEEEDPTDLVYGYVPAYLIRALVAAHGGERA